MAKLDLKKYIRDIPDFPKPGILFKDITTLLSDPEAFEYSIEAIADSFKNNKIDAIVAVEARGFIFGGAVANKLKAGFIPVRKRGKLPWKTKSVSYELEYGTDSLEIHQDAIKPGSRILIVDDLLATGGTVKAVTDLVKEMQGVVAGVAFVIELGFLKGREKLKDYPVVSLIQY